MDCEYEQHNRTIIHLDMDCFYAQVEMLKNPDLFTVPLGIQQKNIVVTSNYEARKYGIEKCMQVTEALKLCPNLVLVKGEDLYDYRQMSLKIGQVLQKYTILIEKLGLDENFLDVTQIINERLPSFDQYRDVEGHVFSNSGTLEECICGCHERLKIGSWLAKEIRDSLQSELGITCCAGVSHNKLLAKLVCAKNKPNQQTTLSSNCVDDLLNSLPNVTSIPGIGVRTGEILANIGIVKVSELQQCNLIVLQKSFGKENAQKLKDLSQGRDGSPVKPTGKPLSIGLEDSCKTISLKCEVEEKYRELLKRLMELQSEDGRVPVSIKVTVRKYDCIKKQTHPARETKQCSLASSYFICSGKSITLADGAPDKIIQSVMRLFDRIVDISKPFHITLLGLAFTKFQERKTGRSSIASYLMKNIKNTSVQSVMSLQNVPSCELSPSPMELSGSGSDFQTDNSDTEVEPSPKKAKLGVWMAKRRCLNTNDVSSPSKLRVSELRLNSRELDRVVPDETIPEYPPDVDPGVFRELPDDVQKELRNSWIRNRAIVSKPVSVVTPSISKPKANNISRYFITNK